MKTNTEAVLAVSQQFRDRMSEVVDAIMPHLTDATAHSLLGSSLAALSNQGSRKSIVLFALYGDVLRVVQDALLADGELSDEELRESLGLLRKVSSGYAAVRKSYGEFANLDETNARRFLATYEGDGGLFGYANESTKWAGVQICRNIEQQKGDARPLQLLGNCLVGWSDMLLSVDGVTQSEEELAGGSLRSLVAIGTHISPSSTVAPPTPARSFSANCSDLFFSPPDSDGDTQFGIHIAVQNSTTEDAELLKSGMYLLNHSGLPLEEFELEEECSISPSDSHTFEADYLGYVPTALLRNDPGTAKLIGTAVLCRLHYAKGPSVPLPHEHLSPGGTATHWRIDDVLEVTGVAVWRTEPDSDDGSFNLQLYAAYKNLTNRSLPKLVMKARLVDSRGRDIDSTETEETLLPSASGMADMSFWNVHDQKLDDASVHFEVTIYSELMSTQLHASHATRRSSD